MGRAQDHRRDEHEDKFARLVTAIGKYWICKRAPTMIAEASECLGGAGYVEETILPRLYREAPVNSIWEGSGNVQCLMYCARCPKSPACWRCCSPNSAMATVTRVLKCISSD